MTYPVFDVGDRVRITATFSDQLVGRSATVVHVWWFTGEVELVVDGKPGDIFYMFKANEVEALSGSLRDEMARSLYERWWHTTTTLADPPRWNGLSESARQGWLDQADDLLPIIRQRIIEAGEQVGTSRRLLAQRIADAVCGERDQ